MRDRTCTVDGCELPRPYKLYCNGHYRRWKRTGSPGSADLRAVGPKGQECAFDACGKPVRSSGLCGGHYLQKWSGIALRPLREQADTTEVDADGRKMCSRCEDRLPVEAFHSNKRIRGGLSPHCKRCHRSDVLQRTYGITIDQFEAMSDQQGGACAICRGANDDGRNLFVDHNHTTGAVRGLLCVRCNRGVGNFLDNIEHLRAAIAYLERHTMET